jgi:hypothetical protein
VCVTIRIASRAWYRHDTGMTNTRNTPRTVQLKATRDILVILYTRPALTERGRDVQARVIARLEIAVAIEDALAA